jgi:hypothetical protein
MSSNVKTGWLDSRLFQRILEIFPGSLSWTFLSLPIILSFFKPIWVAYFIIAFDLFWLIKSFRLAINLIRGYSRLHQAQRVDWPGELKSLRDIPKRINELQAQYKSLPRTSTKRPYVEQQLANWKDLNERQATILDPSEIYNAVIVATYNESIDILGPSVEALSESEYDMDHLILIIAYEQRGGAEVAKNAHALVKKYGSKFKYAAAIEHPDGLVGEHKGKGANITWAGRKLTEYVLSEGIDPTNVIVTTLDADHRPSSQYFSQLTFMFATDVNRLRRSYQPIAMFFNNIWDAPAPMRLIATGNSFWLLMESMRPNRMRNYASHSQGLGPLIETDYWSVTTIVEDGHQYWRSYFAFDGDHKVVPIYAPVYQDAVLADTYVRTFKAQYLQLRRWAWGVTDIPYVVKESIRNKRAPLGDKFVQFGRLLEGHFSWATAPLIVTFVAWLPLYLNSDFSDNILAHQLPVITSRIMTVALVGLFITITISLISLPPRPARYKRRRHLGMILQWVLIPFTSIIFSACAALDAQTRLMLGKYMEFLVTEKGTRK